MALRAAPKFAMYVVVTMRRGACTTKADTPTPISLSDNFSNFIQCMQEEETDLLENSLAFSHSKGNLKAIMLSPHLIKDEFRSMWVSSLYKK
jgi:hypothetical protein